MGVGRFSATATRSGPSPAAGAHPGPASTSIATATSATLAAIGPYALHPYQCSSMPPATGTVPRPGLKPTTPQFADGMRIDPPPSEPRASGTRPAATAAA